ncbi:MAG: dihydroorotase [Oscillospiraceae bacterium]
MRYLLQNAQILSSGGVFRAADVLLSDGRIVSIGDRISCPADAVSIDLHKAVLFPGFVDVHVHLREPGFSYKETIRTGTLAAAHGGFAHVAAMPNLDPVPDCAAALAVQRAIIEKDALVHVHPYGAISVGEKGERLADLDGLAPGVIAFSDDGRGVQSESLMREGMMQCRRLGKILAAHCEDNSLLHGGYIHDGAYARAHGHRGICSESEWGPIARDLRLAEETGCAYHVCHVSTKESVALIRAAKRRGVDVTCETAPHYLTFTDEDLQEDGRFKMNPPLRAREDRDALIEGLLDGTIDMLVTDHAPHSREEKARGLEKSAMGVVGLETSFAASYTALVQTGILPLEKLVDLMHGAPMRRFGCGTELAEGQPADLTAFDLTKTYTVDPETFLTMGRATPFAGCALTGVCKLTMIGGEPVWKEETL